MAISDIRGSFSSRMPSRPERPMRPSRPERTERTSPSASESKPKELAPLSQRGNLNTGDVAWQLRSHKNEIYEKYKITGKEVDEVVKNIKDYKKLGSVLEPHESLGMEKQYDKTRRYGSSATERIKSGRWEKIFRDPGIFKK